MRGRGREAWMIYRAATWIATPFINMHITCRSLRGFEHPVRWPERLGRPSVPRPPGPLLWFHAVSLGEAMSALPIIERCIQARPGLNILMTTSTLSAFSVLERKLPQCVIYQFAPVDTPPAIDAFLTYWYPDVAVFIESELWPNLLLSASGKGILLALLNAKMSEKSIRRWLVAPARSLISAILSQFSLIVPQNTQESLHFQLLGASPFVVNFAGNLKYVLGSLKSTIQGNAKMEELMQQFSGRDVWMASSTHEGEEDIMLWIHMELKKRFPDLLTIIVPRHPERGNAIAMSFQYKGMVVACRSQNQQIQSDTDIYLVDTIGELSDMYRCSPIAVVGGSFFQRLKGHNIAEAAASGCAVLTGPYIGHFSQMVQEMQNMFPYSIQQVSGKAELLTILQDLLSDKSSLDSRRQAAKQAISVLAEGVLDRVWHLLNTMILAKSFDKV